MDLFVRAPRNPLPVTRRSGFFAGMALDVS